MAPSSTTQRPPKITFLPFYGGAKGQTLKVTELQNGTIFMEIIQTPQQKEPPTVHPTELEMPQLPHRPSTNYGLNLKNIHEAALNILKLQEAVRKQGHLDDSEEAEYRESLESLQSSADNLSRFQQSEDEDDEDFNFSDNGSLKPWFERKKTMKKEKIRKRKKNAKKKEEERKKTEEEELKRKKEEQKKEEEEEKKKPEKEEEIDESESVDINLPPEDAAVAEAKPVGLAIAGLGGVAASKPIATAVVGPGGLAIARPVGTAIAGVSPDQVLIPIYGEDSKKNSSKKNKTKLGTSEYLNKIISRYHQV